MQVLKGQRNLHLGSVRVPTNIFVMPLFVSADLSILALRVPEGPHQFCSTVFVLLTFLHLPITQCSRVPTNFCSAVFCSAVFCSTFLLRSFCSASHPCVTFTLHNILLILCNYQKFEDFDFIVMKTAIFRNQY